MKKPTSIFRTLFGYTLLLINLLVSGWLFVCLYASVTSPLQHHYIAAVSLTTSFAILLNCAFFIVWLFSRKKWRSLLSLATLLVCHQLVSAVFGLNFIGKNNMQATLDGIKILSWNVHGLGLYDRPVDKERPENIFRLIEEQDPDILCMIEYYTNSDGSNKKALKFFKDAGYKEYRFSYDNSLGTKIFIGNAVFSKYPLSNFEEIQLDDYIKMMRCDVTLPDESKVRLYLVHLQSFLLADTDKAFIEKIKTNTDKLEEKPGYSRTFLQKLQKAYAKRAPQAEKARQEIDKSPYPVLLCADFNDVPASYTYTRVKGSLNDAFSGKGKGLGRTYNLLSPTLRIDYIFYNDSMLELMGYQSLRTPELSDHNPIIANFRMKKKAA